MALTPKQQRFVDLYVIPKPDGSLNASKAYRAAYPNCKTDRAAESASSRLLQNVEVKAAVDALLAELRKKARMTAEEAWKEVGALARSDIGAVLDFSGETVKMRPANEIPEEARRCIKSMKVKRYMEGAGENAREVEVVEFTFWDKPSQLVTVLRASGEFKPDEVKITGNVDVTHRHPQEVINALTELRDAIAAGADQLSSDNGVPPDDPGEPIHPGKAPPG